MQKRPELLTQALGFRVNQVRPWFFTRNTISVFLIYPVNVKIIIRGRFPFLSECGGELLAKIELSGMPYMLSECKLEVLDRFFVPRVGRLVQSWVQSLGSTESYIYEESTVGW